ncbi:MAG: hypothetical protein SP4CHLAM5_05150 [Chlamydiia bacterium]|nr:hypothetical protein [Chlamydiia bacterium]MCH9618386.1 hypothetical protein [Chlamydiia bacterium]MCH9624296.1 hypothetical protein [Chlamydiia bacterium]
MDELELYIDRLRAGEYKDYSFISPPDFMDASDKEALFKKDIEVEISATIGGDHLIFDISIQTDGINYCKICNDPISHALSIKEKHTIIPLSEMKCGIFSLKPYVRELIFLNIPRYSECGGQCPERNVIDKYLKTSDHPQEDN